MRLDDEIPEPTSIGEIASALHRLQITPGPNESYDSPIEDLLGNALARCLAEGCRFSPQVEVNTICGRFIIDFVVTAADWTRVAFECDGKQFHDPERDAWRDAMILGAKAVDSITRLRGCDIHYQLYNVLHLLSKSAPSVFSDEATKDLAALAAHHARGSRPLNSGIITGEGKSRIEIRRRSTSGDEPWRVYFDFASSIGGGNLDQVIARWRAERKRQ